MPGSASELPVHPVRVIDTKVERREKLKESRKILAYPYCRPLGEPRRARETRFPPQTVSGAAALYTSSAQENFRLARFYRRSSAFIGGQYRSEERRVGKEGRSPWS